MKNERLACYRSLHPRNCSFCRYPLPRRHSRLSVVREGDTPYSKFQWKWRGGGVACEPHAPPFNYFPCFPTSIVMVDRNYLLISSVVCIVLLFSYFHDPPSQVEGGYSGIVHGIRESSSGYTFQLDTSDGTFRCFHSTCPVELGYYRVDGEFSDDGSILFVSDMFLIG